MKFIKSYGLSIMLILLFLISWFAQGFFQWQEYTSVQKLHNSDIKMEDYVSEFMNATFENWQSEFLQLFTFVILSTYLIHKNSPQSRDSDDETKKILLDIQKQVKKK